jgi:hypothetical protein
MKSHFFFIVTLTFIACNASRTPLTSGEYSHGLHLCTRADGTFYAWFAADSIADSAHFALLCVPHTPRANIAAWQIPHDEKAVFGVVEHLGEDSISIQLDKFVNPRFKKNHIVKAITKPNKMVFALKKQRDDWANFYFFKREFISILYEKPDLQSPHIIVPLHTRLYSPALVGQWAAIDFQGKKYWVPCNRVF